jgi:hypothetical protein
LESLIFNFEVQILKNLSLESPLVFDTRKRDIDSYQNMFLKLSKILYFRPNFAIAVRPPKTKLFFQMLFEVIQNNILSFSLKFCKNTPVVYEDAKKVKNILL